MNSVNCRWNSRPAATAFPAVPTTTPGGSPPKQGYGYYGGYLGRDLAVEGRADSNADFGGSDDVPLLLPALPDGHDRGIAHDPEGFAKVFDKYPGYLFTGLDEYIGYQHADIGCRAGAGAKLTVSYDPHYCRALVAKPSSWDLHVADWLRPRLQGLQIVVDGKSLGAVTNETQTIAFAAGATKHTIELAAASNAPRLRASDVSSLGALTPSTRSQGGCRPIPNC